MAEDPVKALFDQVVELTPEQRDKVLAQCEDEVVRDSVIELIKRLGNATSRLDQPASDRFNLLLSSGLDEIDEFEILDEIGRGGMGIVYLAKDRVLDREVALKVMNPLFAGAIDGVMRFRKEAQAAAALNHVGIVPIYRFGESNGLSFLAMEYVPGETLEATIGRCQNQSVCPPGNQETGLEKPSQPDFLNELTLQSCVEIIVEIGDALEHAHQRGVVHRDVKPGNILVSAERDVKLTDFGIAQITNTHGQTSTSSTQAGTPSYLSPEQVGLEQVRIDHRTDIFSLSVILYEMITGTKPFVGQTKEQLFRAIQNIDPVLPKKLNRDIDQDLATVCMKAIEKDPRHRYQSAGHFVADLRSWIRGDPVLARPAPIPRRVKRWVMRHRGQVAAGFLFLSVIAVLLMAATLRSAKLNGQAWVKVDAQIPVQVTFSQVKLPEHTHLAPLIERDINTPSVFHLPPGAYRVDIRSSGDDMDQPGLAQLDLRLHETGQKSEITIDLHDKSVLVSPDPNSRMYFAPIRNADWDMAMTEHEKTIESGVYMCGPGSSHGENPVYERRPVQFEMFYFDKHEVSNREYMEFLIDIAEGNDPVLEYLQSLKDPGYRSVEDADYQKPDTPAPMWLVPRYWHANGYDTERESHPVVSITLNSAKAYASWCGKRLPTMHEWESAAATKEEHERPGNLDVQAFSHLAPTCDDLRDLQKRSLPVAMRVYNRRLRPVDVDALAPESGIMHLFGNVREMTSSINPVTGDFILRGRSCMEDPANETLRSAVTMGSDGFFYDIGFRCARGAR